MKRAILSSFVLAVGLAAQSVTVTSPPLGGATNVDRPFAGGIGRYQQWYSAQSLQSVILEPRRIEQLEFFAGNSPTAWTGTINCEILLGHGKFSGVTGTFDSNWDDTPVLVKPMGNVTLLTGTIGQVCMTVPLPTRFTWDRTRPILMEIRITGNSNNNQPFNYNFRGHTALTGTTSRVYFGGNTANPTGTVTQGMGMVTRFTARPGAVLNFGTGCPGEGGFVPQGGVQQIPSPGIGWTHVLTQAAPQRIALWVVGDTNQSPFPLDLTALLGLAPSGCMLRMNPLNAITVQTVGGSPGSGLAQLLITLPPTTGYVGMSLFSQWVVFDPLAANGVLSVTGGLWSIVAPVGG